MAEEDVQLTAEAIDKAFDEMLEVLLGPKVAASLDIGEIRPSIGNELSGHPRNYFQLIPGL